MKIDVAKHISALLYENDKVVIPELGTFLTIQKPAEINKFQQLSPATKEVIFDRYNSIDDRFLIESIANQFQITTKEAEGKVTIFVNEIKNNLPNRAIALNNIGRLFLDKNKEITFAPSNTNFSNDGFGLPKIDYSPIIRQTKKVEVEPIEEIIAPKKRNGINAIIANIWGDTNVRAIVLICILILLVFQISRFINNESEIVEPSIIENNDDVIDSETNIDPYEKTIDNTPQIITETEIIEEEIESVEIDKIINQKPQSNSNEGEKGVTIESPESETSNRKNYIINIGNFSTAENADIATAQVKKAGYVAYIKKISNTKYRVGISLSSTEEGLDIKLDKIKAIFPDAWVMNR